MTPSISCGKAASPRFSDVDKPWAKSGLWTSRHVEPGEGCADAVGFVAGNRHDVAALAGTRGFSNVANDRLVAERGNELVRAHARRTAGGEDHAGDARRVTRQRFGDTAGRAVAAGSGFPSAIRRRPCAAISADVTSMPASTRSSTQSNPFSFGELAQLGMPIDGVAVERPHQQQIAGIDGHAEPLDAPTG